MPPFLILLSLFRGSEIPTGLLVLRLSQIFETQLDMTVLTEVYDSVDPLRHWENSGRGGCRRHMLPLFEQCCENMISNAQLVHHPNRHWLFNVLWLAERPHEVVLPESRAI